MKRGQRVTVHHGIGRHSEGVIARTTAHTVDVKLDTGGWIRVPRHMVTEDPPDGGVLAEVGA